MRYLSHEFTTSMLSKGTGITIKEIELEYFCLLVVEGKSWVAGNSDRGEIFADDLTSAIAERCGLQMSFSEYPIELKPNDQILFIIAKDDDYFKNYMGAEAKDFSVEKIAAQFRFFEGVAS